MLTISVGNGSFLQYTLLYMSCFSLTVCMPIRAACPVWHNMFSWMDYVPDGSSGIYASPWICGLLGVYTQHATATSDIDLLWGITGSPKQGLYAVEFDARFFSGVSNHWVGLFHMKHFDALFISPTDPFLVRLAVGITFNLPAGARGLLVGGNGDFPGTYVLCNSVRGYPYLATCVKDLFVEES